MIPNQITRLTADEADELLASNRRKVQHQNASTARAERKLFPKNAAQLKLDAQVRANCSNAGVVNCHDIADEQAKAHAIIAKGGRALPPPNRFGEHAGSVRSNANYLKNLRIANSPKR
jgi:homoaconitase/3-isopropylmalate dehydratase large subunit